MFRKPCLKRPTEFHDIKCFSIGVSSLGIYLYARIHLAQCVKTVFQPLDSQCYGSIHDLLKVWIASWSMALASVSLWSPQSFCRALGIPWDSPSTRIALSQFLGFSSLDGPMTTFPWAPLTRARPGGHICAPPIGFSQIAEKWRRAASPNLA